MTREADIAWAAGLFEGEGCISNRGTNSGAVRLAMTDEDVVRRFGEIMHMGSVHLRIRPAPYKPVHVWEASNKFHIHEFLVLLLPHLGDRRREKALAMLERLEGCRGPQGLRLECPQGHPYDDGNTYQRRDGSRGCRECNRIKVARRNAERSERRRHLREAV